MIEVRNLYKKFGAINVLENINIQCEKGKIYGLIGRNGSGKTVLLKCLCGLLTPSEGEIYFRGKQLGKDMEVPGNVGILIEAPGYLSGYSAYQNLKFLADINKKIHKNEIGNILRKVGLDPENRKTVDKYSMGMKQRLGIAQAIMEDQDILLLDEPMNGLDDNGVDEIRKILLELKDKGYTIILSSHNREDIHLLCDEVFSMKQGVLNKIT